MELQTILDKIVVKYKDKANTRSIYRDRHRLVALYEKMTLRRDQLDNITDELEDVAANFKKRNKHITDEEVKQAIFNALYKFFNT